MDDAQADEQIQKPQDLKVSILTAPSSGINNENASPVNNETNKSEITVPQIPANNDKQEVPDDKV